MKKSTLTLAIVAITAVLVGVSVKAEAWVPSGYAMASVSSKAISPCTSSMYYDKPYAYLDGGLNLPAGFMVEVDEYVDLADMDPDNRGVDEFDVYLYKTFALSADSYLKFRVSYWNCLPVGMADGNDALAYDAYLGKNWNWGGPNTVKAELRVQYWHYIRDFNEGMISVMPSVSHQYQVSPKFVVYDKLGLQWNDELAPYGELFSGQLGFGLNAKLSQRLTWNVIDVIGILPFTHVDDGDPRSQNGDVAITTGLTLGF